MPRTLYSPRLSDDVVRALYREGRRRRMPMTRLADELIRSALARAGTTSPIANPIANTTPTAIHPFNPEELRPEPSRVDAA